ncbi:MAG: ubiquinone biosynthesis regulatory protein kinase UbiB [Pseudohongiella sp.]|nr:ubiquinone biosynthesis regulatory protein kinase UbiB [Pseudohongiella sp.]MDO9520437.1 ubiquinone biosynthesis regulatory protein kinase UbiB [Pseudohongiella sp.]MDP2126554.1 ubiquinone biosynthesis regulatory protein kinase UbiB [Pseudohongiella sp.]
MSHLPRLLRIVSVCAKYRLDQISPLTARAWPLRLAMYSVGIFAGNKTRDLTSAQRLKEALQELGPIYIKFGQLLSTRRDFLPLDISDELQNLQDRVPGFTSPTVFEVVEKALGARWQDYFADIKAESLASASIAQVHEAHLITGEEVVIKILRPGIEKTIREDIKVLKWAARLVERYLPDGRRLKPREVINDYEHIILGELNLLSEGANTTLLRRNFENSPKLYVPKVYWDVTRDTMLVTERIRGIPVSDIAALNAQGVNLKQLAETGVNIFFTQVFEHSFFHADMHPGNIFVDPSNPEYPRYIAIDCAIIGSLSREDQQYLARNLLAIFKRDYRKVAELHVESGWVPKNTKVVEFEAAMRTVCEPIFEKPLKDISFGYLLVQLFRTAGRFNMEVQPSLVLLQKTLLNVEGLGRQLYPDLDLWQTALPFLENWNRRRMKPSYLWRSLKDNAPDWIEQFPHLPQLVLNSLNQHQKLQNINETLQAALLQQHLRDRRRRKRQRRLLTAILVVAAASGFLYFRT